MGNNEEEAKILAKMLLEAPTLLLTFAGSVGADGSAAAAAAVSNSEDEVAAAGAGSGFEESPSSAREKEEEEGRGLFVLLISSDKSGFPLTNFGW